MRLTSLAKLSTLCFIATAAAQQPTTPPQINKPYVRHTFKPLTTEEKVAAIKVFHGDATSSASSQAQSTTSSTFTLGASNPIDPATGSYLYYYGYPRFVVWDANPSSNYVNFEFEKNDYARLYVYLGKVNLKKTYLVTFNVHTLGEEQFLMQTSRGPSQPVSPFQSTSVFSGTNSIPIVVTPGNNTAILQIGYETGSAPKGLTSVAIEGVTVEEL